MYVIVQDSLSASRTLWAERKNVAEIVEADDGQTSMLLEEPRKSLDISNQILIEFKCSETRVVRS